MEKGRAQVQARKKVRAAGHAHNFHTEAYLRQVSGSIVTDIIGAGYLCHTTLQACCSLKPDNVLHNPGDLEPLAKSWCPCFRGVMALPREWLEGRGVHGS